MSSILTAILLLFLVVFLVKEQEKQNLKRDLLNILRQENYPLDCMQITTKYLKQKYYNYYDYNLKDKYSKKLFKVLTELFDENRIGKIEDRYYIKIDQIY